MKIENIEIEEANINIRISPDVIKMLQLSVGHLSTSINNGSFNAGTPAYETALLGHLQDIYEQMDSIMDNYY